MVEGARLDIEPTQRLETIKQLLGRLHYPGNTLGGIDRAGFGEPGLKAGAHPADLVQSAVARHLQKAVDLPLKGVDIAVDGIKEAILRADALHLGPLRAERAVAVPDNHRQNRCRHQIERHQQQHPPPDG